MSAGSEHLVFRDLVDVQKANARQRIAIRYGDAAEVRALDLSDSYALYIGPQRFERTSEILIDDGLSAVQDRVGTTFYAVTGDAYDVPFSATRGLAANEFLGQHVFTRNVAFVDDFAGSYGWARATATGAAVIRLYAVRGGVSTQVGTVTYAAGLPEPTFAFLVASPLLFIPRDVLQAFAPISSDATLADVAWTLAGTR